VEEHRAPGAIVERLAASLAHALASPLTLIRGRAELLVRGKSVDDVARAVKQVQEQVDGIILLLRRAQEFGRSAHASEEPAEVGLELAKARAIELRAKAAGVALDLAEIEGSGRLPLGSLPAVVSGLLGYLEQSGRTGSIAIRRCRDAERQLEWVQIDLSLASGSELPSGRRALMDPWLEEAPPDAAARLELALALSSAQHADGWFETSPSVSGAPGLQVFLPIRP
jgi:two-component system, NtrC family, sensor kinase